MNPWAETQAFLAVVRSGSFTGAAEQESQTKSVISKRVSDLEKRLGVQLLNRTTRKVTLTPAGERFFGRAQHVASLMEEAEAQAMDDTSRLQGRLRIASPLSFGVAHLAPVFQTFQKQYPNVTLDIDFADRRVDLLQEGYDLAVRVAKLQDSSLIAKRFSTVRHILCASPEYLEQNGEPTEPRQLNEHRCLVYSGAATAEWQFVSPDEVAGTVRVQGVLRANNGGFLQEAAIAGQGIILQPTFLAYQAIRQKALVPILKGYRWFQLNAYVLYPGTRFVPARVRAFADTLSQSLDADWPYWDEGLEDFV